MDYAKIYSNLCQRGKLDRNLKEYTEIHHIIPRCLGGSDDVENLTQLTYREHFLAHWILCRIHKNHKGINYGFLCMLRKQPTGQRVLTSRMYDIIKREFSNFKKEHIKIFNPGKTENSRKAARKRMLEKNPMKLTPEKNRTCQPIRIYFVDGTIEEYNYAKKFCEENNVPYSTMKVWLRRKNSSSKKHGIIKIERLTKEK
jgi:hypothetical protein